jgi:hypothetical protein
MVTKGVVEQDIWLRKAQDSVDLMGDSFTDPTRPTPGRPGSPVYGWVAGGLPLW